MEKDTGFAKTDFAYHILFPLSVKKWFSKKYRLAASHGPAKRQVMILVIDNYDSFTFNLVHYLMELGAEVRVERNDAISVGQVMSSGAGAVLISPGPCTPNDAGISLELVGACAEARMPLLGVCLGHQSIGQYFGGQVVRGGLMHGKTSPVSHDGSGLFAGLPSPFTATRYHSLIVDNIPDSLIVNATADDGSVMGFRHKDLPIHGVQFHPESIATEHGHAMLANFMRIAGMTVEERV
jgi:anthranilate synthase component 2